MKSKESFKIIHGRLEMSTLATDTSGFIRLLSIIASRNPDVNLIGKLQTDKNKHQKFKKIILWSSIRKGSNRSKRVKIQH